MAKRQAAEIGKRSHLGKGLVMLGLAALFADLAFLAQPIEGLVARLRDGVFGLLPTIGLSLVNAARAIALHQLDYFSLISRILVLFTAMLSIIIGFALLRPQTAASSRPDAPDDLEASYFRGRETQ